MEDLKQRLYFDNPVIKTQVSDETHAINTTVLMLRLFCITSETRKLVNMISC